MDACYDLHQRDEAARRVNEEIQETTDLYRAIIALLLDPQKRDWWLGYIDPSNYSSIIKDRPSGD
jgi:hypothetical protein